jgi:hypothetical protein
MYDNGICREVTTGRYKRDRGDRGSTRFDVIEAARGPRAASRESRGSAGEKNPGWPRLSLNDVLQIEWQFAELRICERLHDHEALHEKFAGEPPEALRAALRPA